MSSRFARQALEIIRSPHFWLVAAVFLVVIPLHYPGQLLPFLGIEDSESLLGLERHAIERVVFLLVVVYAGFVFGLKASLVSAGLASVVMVPRAIFVSRSPPDALVETAGVVIVGVLVNLWYEQFRWEKERRQRALFELQAAQRELRSHVATIERSQRQLAAVNVISNIVSQSLNLEDVLNQAADTVMEVAGTEILLIFLANEERQELVLEVSRGVSQEFARSVRRMKVGEGFNGLVAQTGEPQVVEDVSQDPRLSKASVRQEGIHGQVILPLKSKGKVLGTLCVASRRPRTASQEEVDLLLAGANVIGVAIENARLYQEARLMAERLSVSEQSYRELFESAHDAIWVHDLSGKIIMANKACANVMGYEPEELVGMNVREFLSKEALQKARDVRQRLLAGEVLDGPYEQPVIKKDGTPARLSLTTSLISGDGQAKAFQLIARDITEQMRVQENLRFYVQQATRAQEEERKRIARELHDETAQDLVTLSRQLDRFVASGEERSRGDVRLLEELRGQVKSILDGLRRFSQDLRPSLLDDLGLLPALEWLTADMETRFGIGMSMEVHGSERRLLPEAELVLFRVAQEALRNVQRHSAASHVWVTVTFSKEKTTLAVRDDGKGFELPERPQELAKMGKLGIAGMQERASLVGGTLALKSKRGEGTTVTVEVPM